MTLRCIPRFRQQNEFELRPLRQENFHSEPKQMPHTRFTIEPATPEVKHVVCRIVARSMADELSLLPARDLSNAQVCAARLFNAGFSSAAIFHAAEEGAALARRNALQMAKATCLGIAFLGLGALAPEAAVPTNVAAAVIEAVEHRLEDLGVIPVFGR